MCRQVSKSVLICAVIVSFVTFAQFDAHMKLHMHRSCHMCGKQFKRKQVGARLKIIIIKKMKRVQVKENIILERQLSNLTFILLQNADIHLMGVHGLTKEDLTTLGR